MPSYKLLRSNRESGPYSLNDLVTLGLKPYDLIWVDGRSAAWRYPSEVTELKDFAPAVEEQPYDRFYKKSSESEKPEIPISQAPAKEIDVSTHVETPPQKYFVKEETIKQEAVQEVYVKPGQQSVPLKTEDPVKKTIPEIPDRSYQTYQPQPKKQVFVSMPETNGFTPKPDQYQHQQYQQYLPKAKPTPEKLEPVEKRQNPAEEKSYSPIDIHESEETKLETKYTQSLDDIKEMYINTLVQRKTKNRRKEIFRKYVKPALVPLFLLLSGVAIGLVITNKNGSSKALQSVSTVVPQQATPQQKNEEEPTDDKILQPDENQNLVLGTEKKKNSITPRTEVLIQSHKQNKTSFVIPKAIVPEKKQKDVFVADDESVTVPKKNVEVDPSTGERKKVVRDNDEIDTRETTTRNNSLERSAKKNNSERSFIETDPKNLRDMVSVKSNSYLRGAFGGIRGLELTVYNNSGFLLDEVSVELQIMKPSEEPLRTDIITFRNISANGAVTVRVPDSQRGIRVDYRITNIESKQWQRSTAGL